MVKDVGIYRTGDVINACMQYLKTGVRGLAPWGEKTKFKVLFRI
jgi:hypothetical protein